MQASSIGADVALNGPAACTTTETSHRFSRTVAMSSSEKIRKSSPSSFASPETAASLRPASNGRSPRRTASRAARSPV